MNYVPIDNIFNYLPRPVRTSMNDDDLIMGWALNAYTKENRKHTQYVRQIYFANIGSHKISIPSDYKDIHKISVLEESNISGLIDLFNCAECEEDRQENRENPCPITHRYFLNSSYYSSNAWKAMTKVAMLSDDFFCRVPSVSCKPLYFIKDGEIFTSSSSGIVALDYYAYLKNSEGKFILPEEPAEMWQYLASAVERQYLQERAYAAIEESGIDGSRKRQAITSMLHTAIVNEGLYLDKWHGIGTLSDLNISHLAAIQSQNTVHGAEMLREHLQLRYGI